MMNGRSWKVTHLNIHFNCTGLVTHLDILINVWIGGE